MRRFNRFIRTVQQIRKLRGINPASKYLDIACFEMHTTVRELFDAARDRTDAMLANRKACVVKACGIAKQKRLQLERRDIQQATGMSYHTIADAIRADERRVRALTPATYTLRKAEA